MIITQLKLGEDENWRK